MFTATEHTRKPVEGGPGVLGPWSVPPKAARQGRAPVSTLIKRAAALRARVVAIL